MSNLTAEIVKEVPVSISDIVSPGGAPGYSRPIDTRGMTVVEKIDAYREHAGKINAADPDITPACLNAANKALQHEAFLLQKMEDDEKQGKSRGAPETIDFNSYTEPAAQSPDGPIGEIDHGLGKASIHEFLAARQQAQDDSMMKDMLDDMESFCNTPVAIDDD